MSEEQGSLCKSFNPDPDVSRGGPIWGRLCFSQLFTNLICGDLWYSCDANLKIYRVYVETTNKWLSHIGMYAMRDIEAGEELSYDYNYGMHNHEVDKGVGGEQQSQTFSDDQGNDSTHIKCYCGAHNCRKWLWRPPVTDTDSEDE